MQAPLHRSYRISWSRREAMRRVKSRSELSDESLERDTRAAGLSLEIRGRRIVGNTNGNQRWRERRRGFLSVSGGVAIFRRACGTAVLVALCCSSAVARGTVRIHQTDGAVQTYRDSVIHLVGNTVRVFSPDNHDTLIVAHAACSFVGEIQRCLPYRVTLHRNGADHPIAFDRGTVYMNFSGDAQALPRSSTSLPSNGLVLFVRTARGTLIAVHGTIDKVVR